MIETLINSLETIINSMYIGLLVYSFWFAFFNPTINDLIYKNNNLEHKQDILHQAIQKLINIINMDNEFQNEQKEHLKQIKQEINAINKILNIKYKNQDIISTSAIIYDDYSSSANESEQASEDSNISNLSQKNKPALPIQNHITFPHFFIFNEKNFKQTKLQNNNYQFHFIGNDLRLISNELAKFLKVKSGTCMEFNDVYKIVFNYIQENDIINIAEDSKLCKLFGINENEDYEFINSDPILIKILKKLLEPHFRKITYGV